jgi:hypothetical protein
VRRLDENGAHEIDGAIQSTESLDGECNRCVDCGRFASIARAGLSSGSRGQFVQLLRVASAEDERGAAFREALAEGASDAAGRSEEEVGRGHHGALRVSILRNLDKIRKLSS